MASVNAEEELRQVASTDKEALLVTDFLGNSTLHYAAACSSYEAASLIVMPFPDHHFANSDGITPAHIAAQLGDRMMLERLKASRVLLKDTSKNGWTPLHFAVFHSRLEAVQFLIEDVPELKHMLTIAAESVIGSYPTRQLRFLSPLDLAHFAGNHDIIRILLSSHALPSLHCAVISRDFRALSYYLSCGAGADLNRRAPYRNSTALHYAAAHNAYEICHALMESGASVDVRDCDGRSPLDIAVLADAQQATRLIAAKCSSSLVSQGLFLAVDRTAGKIIREIRAAPVRYNPDETDKSGDSLIIRMLKRQDSALALDTIKHGKVNLNWVDSRGAIALHYAAAAANANEPETTLREIRTRMPGVNQKDNDNRTPLMYAVRAGAVRAINYLLEKGPKVDTDQVGNPDAVDRFGMTASVYAIMADVALMPPVDSRGRTPIPFPFSKKCGAMRYTIDVKSLVEDKVDVISELRFYDYVTDQERTVPLPNHLSFLSDSYRASVRSPPVQQFLRDSEDGHARDVTIIHLVVLFGNLQRDLSDLLSLYPDLLDAPDGSGRTPVFWAVSLGRLDYCLYLIGRQANLHALDNNQNTLYHALTNSVVSNRPGANEFCQRISSALENVSLSPEASNDLGQTPVHLACAYGSIAMLQFLAHIVGPSVLSECDDWGLAPLDYALKARADECISYLHSHGVENRLIAAISKGEIHSVTELIDKGYPVNSFDKAGNTPLHTAASVQGCEMAQLLIDKGADLNAMNLTGISPLHIAAQGQSGEIIRMILKKGFKLTEFSADRQPYLWCDADLENKIFLFRYWKRQYIEHQYVNFMAASGQTLAKVDVRLRALGDIVGKYDKSLQLLEMTKSLMKELHFLTVILNSVGQSFNFMMPLHHLFSAVTTLDFSKYAVLYREAIRPTIESVRQNTNTASSIDARFVFLFPLQWYFYIKGVTERFEPYLIDEIDNTELFHSILGKIKQQCDAFAHDLNANEELAHDLQSLFCEDLKDELSNAPLSAIAPARFVQPEKFPLCLLHPQVYNNMNFFFNQRLSLPRLLPFSSKQQLRVALIGDSLLFGNKDHCIIFPIFFTYFRERTGEPGYVFTTPVGTFNVLVQQGGDTVGSSLLSLGLLYRQFKNDRCECGEYALQRSKTKLFQCLSAYVPAGSKQMKTRLMVVKAGKEGECYDTCYATVMEALSVSPIYFNSIARAFEEVRQSIVIIP
jgi:ankyrin repeat protein